MLCTKQVYLMGGDWPGWGSQLKELQACPLGGGPLLSRRPLYPDKRLGFPALGPGSGPRVISQLQPRQERRLLSDFRVGSLDRVGEGLGEP